MSRFGPAEAVRNPSHAARTRPAAGLELWLWIFMRVSGVALVILAVGHMFIMHILTQLGGEEISFAFVTARWGSPFWRIYDLVLLLLAMLHGINGARVVIGDYTSRGGTRSGLLTILYVMGAVWILLGIFVLLTFNPDGAPRIGPFS